MAMTSIAVSEENHWLLSRIKERSGARSLNDALRLLLDGGPHTVWHLMLRNGDRVRATCKRLGITRLTAFGSRVRGPAHENSDLDLVAGFQGKASLLDVVGAQEELEDAFGVSVDLHTWDGLKRRIRDRVQDQGVELLA